MTRQQKQWTVLSAVAVLGVAFFFVRHPLWTAKPPAQHALADQPPAIGCPATEIPLATGAGPAAPGPPAPGVAAAGSPPRGEAGDPQRVQAAREAFLGLLKTWETKNATPLKGTPGADLGGMTIMHLPPVDAVTLESAARLLDQHGIPAGQRKKEFFERDGPLAKNRYVAYSINPAEASGARDTMWIAYMENTHSIRIDPLTGALVITPEKPGDDVSDLPLKYGLERYSHLFSFATAE